MLKLNNITKKYKDNIILDDISIDFSNPGLYILRGINGSGKSTIIKIISGIIFKSKGKLENDLSISYLPDKFAMPKLMKVKDYVIEITNKNIFKELIDYYQLPLNKRIGDLSKGNLQKLGLLQLFYNDSDCYLLDEPLDGLDDFAKNIFKEKIKEKLDLNKIIIMSLHDEFILDGYKINTLYLEGGKIKYEEE